MCLEAICNKTWYVHTGVGIWSLSVFKVFSRFLPADDFVAEFWPCAWCPHILIGVLGGRVLPGGPFWQQVGVPTSSSSFWGPLKFHWKLILKDASVPTEISLIQAKFLLKFENNLNFVDSEHLEHIFLVSEEICVWLRPPKKSATLRPP